MDTIRMPERTYYAPHGGHSGQNELLTGRAVFTEAYAVIPRGVMQDIVTSALPFWDKTRVWILSRPLSGFAETFSQYIVEVAPGGGSERPEPDAGAEGALFVVEGELTVLLAGKKHGLRPGGFAFLPPASGWTVRNEGKADVRFHWVRKAYEAVDGLDTPEAFFTNEQEIAPSPMPGTEGRWATTRFVDPADLRHDMHMTIVTLEPDSPYPFRAGQYASVETMRWPRVWRPYSIANAPTADGLINLHVKAIDAGWVSSALVHHTRVGDTVRLGPPVGAMACDPRSQRDVLLLGGGTGLAPMIALAEELARWNDHRRIHLYFGVRRIEDLYGLERLAAMVKRDPLLRVVPCVSEDHRFRGERGILADVLAQHAPEHDSWTRHDVFVAGSGPMVAGTVRRLLDLGVDQRRIRFDSFDQQSEVLLDVRRLALARSS